MSRTGELDSKIDIYRKSATSDGIGGETIERVLVKRGIWAKQRPLSGRETERFDKVTNEELVVFEVRRRDDILDDYFIHFLGLSFNIVRIPSVGKREMYMSIYAETGVAI